MKEADKGLPRRRHDKASPRTHARNPRRACAARVTVVAVSVCVCVSVGVSVKSHLTSIRRENAATYSAGSVGQKFVEFSLKLLRCRDRALPSLDGHTQSFFLRKTRMCIIHAQVLQGSRCHARAPRRKLSLRCIIALLGAGLHS